MNAKPIIFSAAMIRALLEGRKTQTRRVVKNVSPDGGFYNTCCTVEDDDVAHLCPYGQPGDLLWVRESTYIDRHGDWYTSADHWALDDGDERFHKMRPGPRTIPSIHMSRWASRLTLRITDVRVHRLQEISEIDATADGGYSSFTRDCKVPKFRELWNSIHGAGAWDVNPWVWVLTFEVIRKNVNEVVDGSFPGEAQ